MKKLILLSTILLIGIASYSQDATLKGRVTDAVTKESLIQATIMFDNGTGTVTDFDGYYSINIAPGTYKVIISYVSYQEFKTEVKLSANQTLTLNAALETQTLSEVNIVADVARERRTPVAFTNIKPAKLEEEIAGRDIPMVLNATPGVYATEQGGGDGDARITIRGFSQRNVAVMLDGIPVNDMENGWVYWSNWFGLDAVMRSTQVQRGLSSSKLAIPSIGGTVNILTKGIDSKAGGSVKFQITENGKHRTDFGYTTGRLKKGWGITMAGSYKQGGGWVDMTDSKGWFYYLKIDKQIGKHTFTLSGMGAPQEHAQRSYTKAIATFDKKFADDLIGEDADYVEPAIIDKGLKYNANWGYLERWTWAENGIDTIHADRNKFAEKKNYYHKPQFSFRHFWQPNILFSLSNIAYVSIGQGGGTRTSSTITGTVDDGQIDFQRVYDNNITVHPFRNPDGMRSGTVMQSSINNHYWYGFLSTAQYILTPEITLSGGIDLRTYKGEHYREIYDMLGGKYFIDTENEAGGVLTDNTSTKRRKEVGDKVGYYNDGLVRWAGLFGVVEYAKDPFSCFINFSFSNSSYQRVDYFKSKIVELADTTFYVGMKPYSETEYVPDTVFYNGVAYTINSPEAETRRTDWEDFPGFTIKGGLNYNINESMNIFTNMGYLKKAPRFNNVFNTRNEKYRDIESEIIKAIELGYSFHSPKFTLNLNGYYTIWENRPADYAQNVTIDGESYSVNINGMNALHKGIEFEFIYQPIKQIDFEGSISFGDWRWTSSDTAIIRDDNEQEVSRVSFDAKNVHVGDAPQTSIYGSLRYQFKNGIYVKPIVSFIDRYYSLFDPMTLNGDNSGRDSWKVPSHVGFDFNFGWSTRFKGYGVKLNFNVNNILDTKYISDASNNDQYTGQATDSFDAKSAGVFFGLGRNYVASIKFEF